MTAREFVSTWAARIEMTVKLVFAFALAMVLPGFLLYGLYRLVAPLFGADPLGHVIAALGYVGVMAAIVTVWSAVIVALVWAWDKFEAFRLVITALIALMLLTGFVANCSGIFNCVPGRYVEC
jgi:hypothetical protein